MSEYQPRTVDRLVEILRSQDQNPRSWQQEAAGELERMCNALELIAGSTTDRLQEIHAKQALPNIGPALRQGDRWNER
jgi:hypothetical protein